jgi:uncharacterized protein YwqG
MTAKADLEDFASQVAINAVQCAFATEATRSHFGGTPSVSPSEFVWPEKDGKKLSFLAQLDLVDLHRSSRIPWLPETGVLLFFYDTEEQPWGIDPSDRGGWSVQYVPKRATASFFDIQLMKHCGSIAFREFCSLPEQDRPEVAALRLNEEQSQQWFNLQYAMADGPPFHQVAGFPIVIQNDEMELDCAMLSNGISTTTPIGYRDSNIKEIKKSAKHWKLLLQLDSDDSLGWSWGDTGRIFFFVREQDANDKNFESTWLKLQCS